MTNNGYVYRDQISSPVASASILDFYTDRYSRFTRKKWRERIESGQIRINGKTASCETRLKPGDILTYHRPPWTEPEVPLNFRVHFEDDHILVVGKPPGLPVLPQDMFLQHTLLYQVRQAFGDSCTPIHRLDRGTSGLVLFVRTRLAGRRLSMAMQNGGIEKTYIACVSGESVRRTVHIRLPIGLHDHPLTGKAWGTAEKGRTCHTICRFIHRNESGRHLVMVKLVTGRSHQIRIHLSAIGNPLVGDPAYGHPGGKPDPGAVPGDTGFFLHAWRLRFHHPVSRERLRITDPVTNIPLETVQGEIR